MEKFLELPLSQKLLVTGILMAVIGGLFYYFVISGFAEDISDQMRKYQFQQEEYNKLKEFDSPQFREKLAMERKEAEKKKEEYKKMLPVDEEIPELIMSVKADADVSGLTITKFEKSKEKIREDYYAKIPVKMEVFGTFYQFLTFLKSISSPNKRILSVKDLTIEDVPPSKTTMDLVATEIGPIRILKEREKLRPLTEKEKYALQVLLFEEQSRLSTLKISFTTNAFVFTGEPKEPLQKGAPAGGGH